MTNACLSHLRCDQLLNGELAADEAAALAHADGCARCATRLDAHRRERAAFAIPMRPRRRLPYAAAGALAAAAIAIGVLATRPRPTTTRAKGAGFTLGLYVRHAGVVRRGASGERVAPGDAIELAATSDVEGFLAIVAIDRDGVASAYYPAAELAAPLAAGRDRVLPSSVILDDTLGPQRIVGFRCDHAISVEAAERAARATVVPPGCASDELAIDERRAP